MVQFSVQRLLNLRIYQDLDVLSAEASCLTLAEQIMGQRRAFGFRVVLAGLHGFSVGCLRLKFGI